MAEFFITLPSNVSDHPENSSSSFLVRLPEPIMLKSEKWKCGLAEIIYSNSFENIPDPLKFTAIDKSGKRTDYYLPSGNYRDALALVESSITSNKRKRSAPTEESKPLTDEENKEKILELARAGKIRPATAEEIAAKLAQIEERKAKATALVVGSAIASDAAAYIPPPKPAEPSSQPPVQPPTQPSSQPPSQPPTQPPNQPTNNASKPVEPKYEEQFDKLVNKFIKQSDSLGTKVIKGSAQNTDRLIEESKKVQALLQDSINTAKTIAANTAKEDKINSGKIVEEYKKHASIIREENQKLQELMKESIAIQKANAADSKRIANQANVRGYSFGRAQEQYAKFGFSFDFDPLLHRIIIYVNRNVIKGLELSPELTYLCGFSMQNEQEPFILDEYKTIAPYSIDFNNNVSAIYVYADCVQPSIVGNCKSQLLRIIPTSNQSSTVSTVFNPIQHLAISKEFIDTIRIKICDGYGNPIKFNFGSTICTLHFVKIRS